MCKKLIILYRYLLNGSLPVDRNHNDKYRDSSRVEFVLLLIGLSRVCIPNVILWSHTVDGIDIILNDGNFFKHPHRCAEIEHPNQLHLEEGGCLLSPIILIFFIIITVWCTLYKRLKN